MTLHKPPRAHHNNNNNNYSVQIVPGFPNIEIHYSSHCVLLVSARNRADVYVCNPCAAQCWSLPARESRSLFATTIDFDASAATNAYRVFAFSKVFIMGQPLIASEVYSSVTDAWTKRSPIALTRDATTQPPPPASAVAKANGGMYVMAERDRLLRFDVEGSAPTRAVRLPTTGDPWRVDTRCLGESEGMILYGFLDGFLFRVWELQSDEGWKMRHSVTVQWLWGKLREAAMPTRVRTPPGMFAPLGFHGDVEGVFFQMDERVVVLEMKTKEMEVVYRKVGGMEGGGEFRDRFLCSRTRLVTRGVGVVAWMMVWN
ncbi:hypothetical protein QJS10_CPB18g01732 [Acorus calamus]|uniref:F-box protein At3g26010-like beta-propeller domain-containing protein n=1 Tax=Acorus calamus TaxID=4465 RepID=A0AAV9CL84_ACOCL|nr:hypothetical protein QJS10_CPB18g01732 [Acorus calamus]